MATSGAYRGFVAIRIEWRRTIAAQVEVKLPPQCPLVIRRFKRRKDGDSIRTLLASISLTSTRKQFATQGDLQYHTS